MLSTIKSLENNERLLKLKLKIGHFLKLKSI